MLQKRRAFGYPLLCISFPLLERYLREKSRSYQSKSVNETFYQEFVGCFPEIKTKENAKKIWRAYRNGLLHQGAPNRIWQGGWKVAVSHDYEIVAFDEKNRLVIINPRKLSQRTIDIICADFGIFEGHGSPDHPLPKVIKIKQEIQTVPGTILPLKKKT